MARRQLITEREHEIITLVAQGLTDQEIGRRLAISSRTVSAHMANVLRSLPARNRTHAVYIICCSMIQH